jgi:hypothetical protein
VRAQEFVAERKIADFRSGNLNIELDDHAIEQAYFRRVNHKMVDRAIMKLKYIEKELASLEPGEKAWVVDPDHGFALGIRRREKLNTYLFATIVDKLTYDSDVPVFQLPSSNDVNEQQLDELTFLGSECTKDCSGHRAGYEWSARKGNRPGNSPYSPSFNKGANLRAAGK